MTGLIWTKEFPEFQSDISESPCINFITFRSSPTSMSAAPVASGAQAVALCRQSVCLCWLLHNADKLLCRLKWACHCTTYGQFQCLVLRTVVMFGSYFSLSGLFLPAFRVTASRTTEHIVPAHYWVMRAYSFLFMSDVFWHCVVVVPSPKRLVTNFRSFVFPVVLFFLVKFDAFSVLNVKLVLFCGTWRRVIWYVEAAACC